ncbi:MAG: ATP-dependent zinc metalloprotease FtsH [Clostridia bacterium]|nr:ATP-dependent zinc metalloprotease FtsH [Clostridia bacterium]
MDDKNLKKPQPPEKKNGLASLIWLILPLIFIFFIYFGLDRNTTDKEQYYQLLQNFDQQQVTEYSLDLSNGKLTYKLKNEKESKQFKVPNVNIFIKDVHDDVRAYNKANPDKPIKIDYVQGVSRSWLLNVLPSIIFSLLLVGFIFYMFKKMNQTVIGENNKAMFFGKAKIKSGKDEKKKTTFDDVAGCDEEKEELKEVVEFLKEPGKFNNLGARIPHGVLLVGPPGTGKTLLARAVAGEANAPFFSISGSDFVEMYVGVGASRVRDLFDTAKKNSPSIIFIDEIDAVGRHRGAGMGGGHDEREQTLNQLLVEMDGFGVNEGVVVMAATNRPDILDPALLRPGRFDRQIAVSYPDIEGRFAILKVHAKNKPLAPDVNLHDIAKATAGFTGADLENLLNEAALLAARNGLKAITMPEIEEATVKVIVGTEKKSRKISENEKRLTAYHEAGHAVTNYFLPLLDPVHQISIIPRGLAGGYTMSIPGEDRTYTSKKYMQQELVSLLGGRVAEALIMEDISTGASNDIERATDIARKMVTKYGMSDALGPITFGSGNDEVFLGKDFSHTRNYSETTASEIDREISKIISRAYNKCNDLLKEHVDKLHKVASYLLEKEKMGSEEFKRIMEAE